ncbi:MAG TPA: hypothetical protein VLH18_06420 [Candidatus Limnocylindrales bacterium]|nr:hypothetical protein [Candidatus Limnocylindrales bacterium]
MRLRVWAEFITPEEVTSAKVVALLKYYRVQPCLAVSYGSLGPGYTHFLKTYHDAGLEPALWPTLSDTLGYWPHEGNALAFSVYVHEIFQWAQLAKVAIPWLAIDLETPFYQWQAAAKAKGLHKISVILKHYKMNRNPVRFQEAASIYRELQKYINRQGCRTLVPVLPLLELDLAEDNAKIQDYLETPVTPICWDIVSAMQYNSMFTGYSRGMINPVDAHWHLYRLCLKMKQFFGERASLSIGTTSTGKLGNEPYYSEPLALLPDVEAALAAGIDDIAVFCLEGILKAKCPEAWFEMIYQAKAVVPPRSRKMDFIRSAGQLVYRIIP